MSSQPLRVASRKGLRPIGDLRRSIRYRLTLEFQRLERNGFGESTYASAVRHALDILPGIESPSVLVLLERELIRGEKRNRDRPYASVLASMFSRIGDHDPSCSKLFAYYLERLENEGRGDEPFARALRRALNTQGPHTSTLYFRAEDEDLIGDEDEFGS